MCQRAHRTYQRVCIGGSITGCIRVSIRGCVLPSLWLPGATARPPPSLAVMGDRATWV